MTKFAATILTILLLARSTWGQPVLEADTETWNLGTVPQHSKVFHHYWFKSAGSDTLIIDSVATSCNCAVMPVEGKPIPPGDSILVSIEWNIGRKMNVLGQSSSVYYNGRYEPLKLGMRAFAHLSPETNLPVSIEPYKAELGAYPSRGIQIDSMAFTMTNRANYAVDLSVVSLPAKEYRVVFPEHLEPGEQAIGFVQVRPEFVDSEFEHSITFEASDRKKSRLTIPVRRKIYD